MKWLIVALLLLFLFPLVFSKKHGEPKQVFWHSELPYGQIADFFWCRKPAFYKAENPPVFKAVREALFEQEKWTTALLRDAEKPHDENVVVEMVLLADEEKYRDWDPVWVRKVDLPEKSRIRIFLNEATDSKISEFCKEQEYPSVKFQTSVAIEEFFYTPYLICKLGTPLCDVGYLIFAIPVGLSVIVFILFYFLSVGLKNAEDQEIKESRNRPGAYISELDAYRATYSKMRPDGQRNSWPDEIDMPKEFQIMPDEPSGPYDDPFAIDPAVILRHEKGREPIAEYLARDPNDLYP